MNDDTAELFMLDEIGYFGITAADFTRELAALDVGTINLHISSPGGGVFDGVAIFNRLREHPAKVHVTVDGIAASIASVIAMAGDTVTMGRGAQLMIHCASGVVLGQAIDLRKMADILDKLDRDTIATAYADRAGGTVAHWLDLMAKEQWFSDHEAVAAGLADAVMGAARPSARAAATAQWTGRSGSDLVGEYTAWSMDYAARIDTHARSRDRNKPPAPRTVTTTALADGRVRRDVGAGLTIITPRARTPRNPGRPSTAAPGPAGRPMTAAERHARSVAIKARVRAAMASRRTTAVQAPRRARTTAELHALTVAARARQAARQHRAEAAMAQMLRTGGVHQL